MAITRQSGAGQGRAGQCRAGQGRAGEGMHHHDRMWKDAKDCFRTQNTERGKRKEEREDIETYRLRDLNRTK